MKRPDLPYLEFKKVGGRQYIYYRRGKIRHRLPPDPDTEEFSVAYWALRSGKARGPVRTSWDALINSYLGTAAYKSLSAGSRANYRRHCDDIRAKNGPKDMRTFRRKHAIAARDALQDTWSKANERVAVLSILCRHAVDLEWIDRNPVTDIPKLTGGEYQPWPDKARAAYERYCDDHGEDLARAIYELMTGTGQRIGDCCMMQWADWDGEYIHVVQDKTEEKIWVYCPARLRAYLTARPRKGRYIMAKNLTQPLGKRQVQEAVERVREKIGLLDGPDRLVPHGWRYNAAVELSEAGCSDAEIQSVTGHRSLAMVQKYRRQADQRRLSKSAQERRERNRNGT